MLIPVLDRVPRARSTLLQDLVAYWKLDEASGQRNDSHGTNHLTDNNTVTQAAGKIGNAAQFTSANSEYLSRADDATIATGDIDFSFVIWVYMDTKSNGMAIIAKERPTATVAREHLLYFDNAANRYSFLAFNGASTLVGSVLASTFGNPSAGVWTMIYVEHSAALNRVGISVNAGTLDTAATTGAMGRATGIALRLGDRDSSPLPFNGRMDECGFWKRVLTAAERTRLYNAGAGRSYPFAA